MGDNTDRPRTTGWIGGGDELPPPSLTDFIASRQNSPAPEPKRVSPLVPPMEPEERREMMGTQTDLDLLDLSPWGSHRVVSLTRMATDLVLYGEDVERMARAYGLTTKALAQVRKECRSLSLEIAAVRKTILQGDPINARFRDLVNSSFWVIAEILMDPKANVGARLKAFELAARFGGVEPAKAEAGEQQRPVQITINGVGARTGEQGKVLDIGTHEARAEEARRKLERMSADLDELGRQKVERENRLHRQDDEEEAFPDE